MFVSNFYKPADIWVNLKVNNRIRNVTAMFHGAAIGADSWDIMAESTGHHRGLCLLLI